MPDREKVIKGIDICLNRFHCGAECPYYDNSGCQEQLRDDAIALMKEQEERLRKLQNDKDKLCLEVSEWKHKFHDAPPKFVSQGVVDQILWERDTALSQLEQIGKGIGSKMDDIVALLKEQDKPKGHWTTKRTLQHDGEWYCDQCEYEPTVFENTPFCPNCGAKMEGR